MARHGTLQLIIGPTWVFLPDLHLLLGDGVGAMDAVAHLPERITTWATHAEEGAVDNELLKSVRRDAKRRGRLDLPAATCVHGPAETAATVIKLAPDLHGEYSLIRCTNGHVTMFIVDRRIKQLRQVYRDKMAELGLDYIPGGGIGSRPKKEPGKRRAQRPANEHAFNAWVAEMKSIFIANRKAELLERPETRPMDFDEVRAAWIRSRDGEITRGKRDSNGDPKVPYAEEQLLERVANDVARREAAQMMFDFTYEPVLVFNSNGYITIP